MLRVDAAALVVLALESEGIQHLHLEAILEIDAAVPAPLAARRGHEWQAKFDMQREVAKLLPAHHAALEIAVRVDLAVLPRVGGLAVEKHGRAGGRCRTERRRLAFDALQRALLPIGARALQFAICDRRLPHRIFEMHRATFEHALDFLILLRVGRRPRQPAIPAHKPEFSAAQCDHLRAAILPGVLALEQEVRTRRGGIGEDIFRSARRRCEGTCCQGNGEESGDHRAQSSRHRAAVKQEHQNGATPHHFRLALHTPGG
ncbi:hypothetical protein LBMAG57_02580 [Verrucomicrobiota bacterium]|nr:hypothetical protein LBMAG57_02580 [Verrucomicrobiota bacterium]